jgi:pyridoxal phosphate enzyme (YggS family)
MSIKENLIKINDQIRAIEAEAANGQRVKLIAVTKTRDAQTINKAYEYGVRSLGENRVQEAELKFEGFENMPGLEKRFIGHLQSNKVKKCLSLFDTIDSIHSLKIAKKINNHLLQEKREIKTLLEVNMSGDEQKNGFLPENIEEMLLSINLSALKVEGLMTIGPSSRNNNETRNAFKGLRVLKERLNKEIKKEILTELSMGMSGDYKIGIQEGSTMVRVGTGIFGKRN